MSRLDLTLVGAWLLDTAKRKALYGLLGAVGVLLVALGVATDSLVTGWVGVVVAVVDLAALVLASVKARAGNWTKLYAAAAVVVGALKAAGVLTDGQSSHALDILAAGVAILPLVAAFVRTDTKTPTGEPQAEYVARHADRLVVVADSVKD
ncbi:hypothetical protein [Phycicoccus jejuensis]|uniref:hypothetical protein n=1 Tax=Phycicoccus jejuensis TaxID=367299 RepID=UPI00055A11EC|nr:hypothetical protein [Phycicoccus jejuensis]